METRWLDRPLGPKARRTEALVDLVVRAEQETRTTGGGLLVFLPGEREIRQAEAALNKRLPGACHVRPLYGALPFAAQRAAIQPATQGRKVVLATSIAETSLTIQDVRVVVDMGQARRARFDPGSGMSRLVTEKVTRAEAEQRAGRAGRVAEGGVLSPLDPGRGRRAGRLPPGRDRGGGPDRAGPRTGTLGRVGGGNWGFSPRRRWGALAEARTLLSMLGALDGKGRITDHGRKLSALPLHPRVAHMLVRAGPEAAPLAALIEARDPLRGAPCDLTLRLEALRDLKRFTRERPYEVLRPALEQIKSEAKRLRAQVKTAELPGLGGCSDGGVGLSRPGSGNGARAMRRATCSRVARGRRWARATGWPGRPLWWRPTSTVTRAEAKIRMAAQISERELRELFADQIAWVEFCDWSKRERRVVARRQERLGAITLDDRVWTEAPQEDVARAMLDGVRALGLRLEGAAARLAARVGAGAGRGRGSARFLGARADGAAGGLAAADAGHGAHGGGMETLRSAARAQGSAELGPATGARPPRAARLCHAAGAQGADRLWPRGAGDFGPACRSCSGSRGIRPAAACR